MRLNLIKLELRISECYFEKDNDASFGSKGDYIFRESDENGNEVISIMFEMKNEVDETATKGMKIFLKN